MNTFDLDSYVGQKVNGLKILQILPMNAHGIRKYQVRCVCGTEFTAGVYNVLRGNSKSCGCLIKNGYLRQSDEKLMRAYQKNKQEAVRIAAAFEARNLPEPNYTENG